MAIKFACEHCGQRLNVDEKKVGKKAKCPKCKGVIRVPTAEVAAAALAARKTDHYDEEEGDVFSEFVVYDDEAELLYESETARTAKDDLPVDRDKVAVSRTVLYVQGGLLGVVAVFAFALGMFFGANSSTKKSNGQIAEGPPVLAGKLTYVDRQDQSQPDGNSIVILLPAGMKLRPQDKIAIDGLLDLDPPPAGHVSPARIREWGGAYGRTDADGRFELRVSKPGEYFVLCISRHTLRQDDVAPKSQDLAQVGRFFTSAPEVFGQSKYLWITKTVRTGAKITHDFGQSRKQA